METTQKQMEEMIAAAGTTLSPEKVAELAANLLQAMDRPASSPEAADSSAQTCAEIKEQA